MTTPPDAPSLVRPGRRIAYLGPRGTFTEQALRTLPGVAEADPMPCSTVIVALDAVRSGEADAAVVPIENSVEGSVPVTLDELATGEPLMIVREMTVPVAFSVLVRPGTRAEDVTAVGTHPHAAAQTRRWVAAAPAGCGGRARDVDGGRRRGARAQPRRRRPAGLAGGDLGAGRGRALRPGGARRGCRGQPRRRHPLRRGLAARAPRRRPTGRDKTSLVAFMRDDHPGALLEILEQLTMRGVNLSRIESRPTGAALGNYCFSIDAEGHVADRRVGEALMGLRRICADVRFLGSYERHDGQPPTIRPGTTDEEFEDAQAWLARLRDGA